MRTINLTTRNRNMVLAEHPQDDPFSGPAFGQYEKSKGLGKVLGVVAAVASIATGFGMIGAKAALGATAGSAGAIAGGSLFQSLAGGAMVAGGIAQGIGTLTGNKKLARIGSTLSLVGGVGSMAGDLIGGAATLGDAAGGLRNVGSSLSAGWENSMAKFGEAFNKVTSSQPASVAPPPTIDQGGLGAGMSASANMPPPATNPSSLTMTNDLMSGAALNAAPAGGGVPPPSPPNSGILSKAMDFAQTPAGMYLAGNALMGMGEASVAADQLKQQGQIHNDNMTLAQEKLAQQQQELDLVAEKNAYSQAQLERELANVNFQYEVLDPSDPEFEAKQATAKARGVPTIVLGVNPTSGPVTTAGVRIPANQFVTGV